MCLIFNVNQAILKTLKKDIQFSSYNLILGTHSKSIILLEYLNFLSKNKSHPRVCLRINPNIWKFDHLNSSKLEHLTNLPDEFINNIWTFVLIHQNIWTFEMPQQKHASPQSVFENSSKHSNCCNGATPNLNSSGITPIKIMPDARNTKYNMEDMKVAHLSEHTVRYIKKSQKVQNDFLVR